MHVQALERGAGLAHVEEGGGEQALGDRGGVGARQHDGRVVAAQLQRQALEVARRAPHDVLPRARGAGEHQLGDARVLGHGLAHLGLAHHAVDQAGGQHGGHDLHQAQRGQRRERRGLDDHRIARAQRRHDVPHGDHQRPVPRRDRPHHAQRLAVQLDALAFALLNHLDRDLQRGGGARPGHGAAHFHLRQRQGLALLAHHKVGQLGRVLLDGHGHALQRGAALGVAAVPPGGEGLGGGIDRLVELGHGGGGAFSEGLAGGRVDDRNGAGSARDVLAANGEGEVGHGCLLWWWLARKCEGRRGRAAPGPVCAGLAEHSPRGGKIRWWRPPRRGRATRGCLRRNGAAWACCRPAAPSTR